MHPAQRPDPAVRVYLRHPGHPVLGDKLYGGKRAGDYPRQMLHA